MAKIDVQIRAKIKRLMAAKKLSGDALWKSTGVSKSFIYGYLKADKMHKTASVATLDKLAKGLGVKLRDLLP
jgi:transcriptional regulator with XRE-family HTH domain